MTNPPIIRKMMGLANPITAFSKLVTPIIGCKNRIIKEVTARCSASLAHMIIAKIKRAIAACPAALSPGIGIIINTMNATIASGIPIVLILTFVFNTPILFLDFL